VEDRIIVGSPTLRSSTQPLTQEHRPREAHEVWQFVMSVESAETTRAWWMA